MTPVVVNYIFISVINTLAEICDRLTVTRKAERWLLL